MGVNNAPREGWGKMNATVAGKNTVPLGEKEKECTSWEVDE